MPTNSETLVTLVIKELPDAVVAVEDLRGDDTYLSAKITSSLFAGLSRLEQHKLVYKALGNFIDGTIHALTIHTNAPESK